MSTILKGAPVVAAMNEANAARCAALREKGVVPTLAVVRVGERPDDLSYEKGVMARCAKVGVEVKQFLLSADASQEELLRVIAGINADAAIHGCLLFRPLPKQFDDRTIRAALSPEKDIDGKGAEFYPRLPDGTLDYENPDTLDLPLIKQCLRELSETGKTTLPVYDFSAEKRSDEAEPIDLQGGVCLVEGIHALNPELTGLVKGDDIYRIYAGLREEYCIDGRRVINTQDIRLCRRTLRDAATRGRSPEKTLAMWDRVLDGETRYIKGFKTTADFLLDTSFTYELGLISNLLGVVRRQFTLEGHNAELWDETARRFEHVAPLSLDLLPPDSMLREFYGGKV